MAKSPEEAKASSNLAVDLTLEVSHVKTTMEAFKKQVDAIKLYQTQLAVVLACTVESMKLQSETGVLFAPIKGTEPSLQGFRTEETVTGNLVPGVDPLEVPFNVDFAKDNSKGNTPSPWQQLSQSNMMSRRNDPSASTQLLAPPDQA